MCARTPAMFTLHTLMPAHACDVRLYQCITYCRMGLHNVRTRPRWQPRLPCAITFGRTPRRARAHLRGSPALHNVPTPANVTLLRRCNHDKHPMTHVRARDDYFATFTLAHLIAVHDTCARLHTSTSTKREWCNLGSHGSDLCQPIAAHDERTQRAMRTVVHSLSLPRRLFKRLSRAKRENR